MLKFFVKKLEIFRKFFEIFLKFFVSTLDISWNILLQFQHQNKKVLREMKNRDFWQSSTSRAVEYPNWCGKCISTRQGCSRYRAPLWGWVKSLSYYIDYLYKFSFLLFVTYKELSNIYIFIPHLHKGALSLKFSLKKFWVFARIDWEQYSLFEE